MLNTRAATSIQEANGNFKMSNPRFELGSAPLRWLIQEKPLRILRADDFPHWNPQGWREGSPAEFRRLQTAQD